MDTVKIADALGVLCCTLFGAHEPQKPFRLRYWAECFPLDVVLYALVEAELKQRRTEGMTAGQIAMFAERVMLRRLQEKERRKAA